MAKHVKIKGSPFLLGMVGLFLIAAGILILKSATPENDWVQQNGVITDTRIRGRSEYGQDVHHAVVTYKVEGREYTVINASASKLKIPNIGEELTVAYNPENPEEAKVLQGGRTMIHIYSLPVIGAVLVIASMKSLFN